MNYFNNIPESSEKHIVLSASRMTDMPKFYPLQMIERIKERINKGQNIHSLVIWTKHPASLFYDPLYSFLKELINMDVQLYIHLTVSGMGGVAFGYQNNREVLLLEPNVPEYQQALMQLPNLIELCQRSERVCLRIDPLVKIEDNDRNLFSNLDYFERIVEFAANTGIQRFIFSFLEPGMHKKVDQRFQKRDCRIIEFNQKERQLFKERIDIIVSKLKVDINACCVDGFNETKCINGNLLTELHDLHLTAESSQPRKRGKCGCTKSIDIGGWPPAKCGSGCLYCYSSPVI